MFYLGSPPNLHGDAAASFRADATARMDQERVRTQSGFDEFRDEVHSLQDSPFHGFPDQPPHWQRQNILQPPFHQQLGHLCHDGGAHDNRWDGNPDLGRGLATAPLAALKSWFPLLHARQTRC